MKNRSDLNLFGCRKKSRWLFLATLMTVLLVSPFGTLPIRATSEIAQQQGKVIKGTVVDYNDEPIIGANVIVEGRTTGTITDIDGNFRIEAAVGAKLTVSFIGYEKQTVKATAGTMRIVLREDSQMLEEVEVVAYGAQKKVTVTGAIASVRSEDLTRTPVSTVTQTLAGQMTGVSSIQYSGEPGADEATIYIRGQASFNDAEPLIQIDGVVMEDGTMTINDIDPEEIESISILKDASATAVFGVRGANGVILITTKRGFEGKTKISANLSATVLTPTKHVEMANSYEYATMHNQMMENDGSSALFSDEVLEMFQTHAQPILFPDTDWPSYMMKDFTMQTKANVNISGGNKKARYFFSGGYYKQGGLFKEFDMPYDYNYTFHRFNYRSNLDINVTKTTVISANISGSISTTTKPNVSGSSSDIFKSLYYSSPFVSPGIVDGKFIITTTDYNDIDAQLPFTGSNGFATYYGNGYRNTTTNALALQLALKQDLGMVTKGLSFALKGAYNSNWTSTKYGEQEIATYNPRIIVAGTTLYDGTTATEDMVVLTKTGQDGEPSYSISSGKSRNWYFDARFNYERNFGKHRVTGLLLYNQSKRYYPSSYSDIPTGYVGLVGRVTYGWNDRYMAEFNVGYNGSENFAPDKRFGFFPAGSVGWVISEENFFKPIKKVVDFMKFRVSIGLVGSDKGVSRFYYTSDVYGTGSSLYANSSGGYGYSFGISNSTTTAGAYESTKHNQDVTWEKSLKQNYGVDVNFFGSKLKTSFDYYYEHRTGILLTSQTAPALLGFTVPTANLGIVNSWGWELSLKWNDKIGKDFRYWVGANISYNQNKIIDKKEAPKNNAYQMDAGHRIGSEGVYKFFEFYDEGTAARYQAEYGTELPTQLMDDLQYGDCIYVDLDNNGYIDSNDMSKELIYTEDPEYTVGMNFGFAWKGFQLNTQWTGAWNMIRILDGNFRKPFYGNSTQTQGGLLKYHVEHTWDPENPSQDALYPRLTQTNYTNNYATSTLYVADAKYFRLKTLQLSYDFKGQWMKKFGLSTFQVALSGYNLLTFTPFVWGDPETEVNTAPSYPLQRTYTLSLKLGF
ncbi:MAG: TonB-dependent receptor [Bacteroides sp.]|nr:TonB-dependent receptor [Bacteroides sp.]